MCLKSAIAVAMMFLTLPIVAEQHLSGPLLGGQVPGAHPPVIGRRTNTTPRQEPCWQEAGISKGAMQQRRNLERSTRAEIESVCGNSSLTAQQRREQIRAIRERTRQQVDALISPQQRETLRACQQARAKSHTGSGAFHGGGHGEGPCGELDEPKGQAAEPESEP